MKICDCGKGLETIDVGIVNIQQGPYRLTVNLKLIDVCTACKTASVTPESMEKILEVINKG